MERVDSRNNNHVKKGYMTREQIITAFTDLGLEAPNKGAVKVLMDMFNQEKGREIEDAKKTATDEAVAKYKDYVKPEDHQKILDELNAEKGKGALAERKAKYKEANLNIDDEDVFNLIEGKLKDSKDFDKDLADYVKAHPSFLKEVQEKGKDDPAPNPGAGSTEITLGALGDGKGNTQSNFNQEFRNAFGVK